MLSKTDIAIINRRLLKSDRVQRINKLFNDLNNFVSQLYEQVMDEEDTQETTKTIKEIIINYETNGLKTIEEINKRSITRKRTKRN